MKHAFIDVEKAHFPISVLCRVMLVSESGYYAARKRAESPRRREDRRLTTHVRAAFEASGRTYGSPSLRHELRKEGFQVGRHRVRRLMREAGIAATPRRRFVVTTDSSHGRAVAENLVRRRWKEHAPVANRLWVGDITYLPTWQGWAYLAVFIDVFSRKVVGWAVGDTLSTGLVTTALSMAVTRRNVKPGLIVHSDRGVQYTSSDYSDALASIGARTSMSRRGNCWDNALAESFFATLKRELIRTRTWPSRAAVATAVATWIDDRYNSRRRHSALGYVSPTEFERLTKKKPAA